MNHTAIAVVVLAFGCSYCRSSGSQENPEAEVQAKYKAVLEALDAFKTTKRSLPENVETIPEMRALMPPTAKFHPYTDPKMDDSWVTSESLVNVMTWYRKVAAEKGFVPHLRVCRNENFSGGRTLIVDYCSTSKYLDLKLAEDTSNGVTIIRFVYSARPPSFDCSSIESPEHWTHACPVELLP